MLNKFYTNISANDGFGSQYQKIIQTYIFCKMHNLNFVYSPLDFVEHNYTNDTDYNKKLEDLMNLKNIITNLKNNITNLNQNMNVEQLDYGSIVMKYFEANIDSCCESNHMKFIKDCFWENKKKDFFQNDKINVAIHIRRENTHDKGLAGPRATTHNIYYLNIMNKIRDKYNKSSTNKELLFHIYSQGEIIQFQDLANSDVKFYLNYDICESFIGMVSSEILVTSPSSLSYVAALISDGEIYYKRFWHNPRKNWIIYK
jgi:hypothetical protein